MINARQLADTNKNTTRMAHNSINRNAEAEHNNKATLHSVDSYGSRLENETTYSTALELARDSMRVSRV